MANNSPQAVKLRALTETMPPAQVQRKPHDGVSGKANMQSQDTSSKPNHTGLPDQLKSGVESLSGMSLDHVKVHYNSSQPAQLQAHAYAQGSDIHLAPGQEQHLPHEAWHVVQQMQDRVQSTTQLKQGVPVNDDAGLENEADVMGARALNMAYGTHPEPETPASGDVASAPLFAGPGNTSQKILQGAFIALKNFRWGDDETKLLYEQIEARVDNRIKLQALVSKETLYICWIGGQWIKEEEKSFEEQFSHFDEEKWRSVEEYVINMGNFDGEYLAEETQGNADDLIGYAKNEFSQILEIRPEIRNFWILYWNAFSEAFWDIIEKNGWNGPELAEIGTDDTFTAPDDDGLSEKTRRIKKNAKTGLFIPDISYRNVDDGEIEEETDLLSDEFIAEELDEDEEYSHEDWIEKQKQANRISASVTSRYSAEMNEKQEEIFFHVINTGLFSDKAVYTPKEWLNVMLPSLNPDGRKKIAGDVFTYWMNSNSLTNDDVPVLNKKLHSLETQFGLSKSQLVLDNNNRSNMYAELKASPSIFVPVNKVPISGLTVKTGGTDKLDAVQYDGPELSPLGQFLESINTHYKGEDINKNGDKFPLVAKSDTLLNGAADNVTAKFYRPGTVDAVSTTPRGTGRSGSGETQVGRMGVQEEFINTGDLKAGQYEGGHLIGDQIMNPNKFDLYKTWNLAPQENEFNAPVYSSGLENGATKAIKGNTGAKAKKKGTKNPAPSKAEVHVNAEVSYPSDTYKVPVLKLVKRLLDGKNKIIGSTSTTWYEGIEYIQKNKPGPMLDFEFMNRIPGYWHAAAKDVNATNRMTGSITERKEGVQVLTAINPNSVYAPTGAERFQFSIFTGGDSSTGTALPLPAKANLNSKAKAKATYKAQNEVSIYARQKTSVKVGSTTDMRNMTVTQINALIKNSIRANAIKNWLNNNPTDHTLNNLSKIKGIGAGTLLKISKAGWTI